MKCAIIICVVVAILWFLFLYLKHQLGNPKDKYNLKNAIDIEIEKFMHGQGVKQLAVGVYKKGRLHVKGYGEDTNAHTVFQIASISKLFTVLLLQTLCDENKVGLDTSLDQVIGEKVNLSPVAKNITLKQLATHTSGLPALPTMLEEQIIKAVGKESFMTNPYSHINQKTVFDYLATTQENKKHGKFVYSNYGMGILGHVLEQVTNTSYEDLLVNKVLQPLGMKQTQINLTTDTRSLLAQGYDGAGNQAPLWTFNALEGAGAINSNIHDMLKFISAHFYSETLNLEVLQSLKKLLKPKVNIGWMKAGFLEKFLGNKNTFWHDGMVGGYASYISIDPKLEIGVVILTNKSLDLSILGNLLVRRVRTTSWMKGNEPAPDDMNYE